MKRVLPILLASLLALSCTRRPLSDTACPYASAESISLEVSVDWSLTDFVIDSLGGCDNVHRVSFRFFPLDGSAPFDRYLEDNVLSGVIEVPTGAYSVVVFNESVEDSYWQGAIEFESEDSYSLFSAKITDGDPDEYDFYTPSDSHALSVEALELASGSLDEIIISSDDISCDCLNPITLRRLTCTTTIEVDVEYLSSASTVRGSLTGLAQRVFMASGESDSATTTHIGELTQLTWHDSSEQLHGLITEDFLTFSIPSIEAEHTLTLDVILIDGSRHSPTEEMIYDVGDQIREAATRYADNDLGASVSLSLPEVLGDIEVEGWDDDKITIQLSGHIR